MKIVIGRADADGRRPVKVDGKRVGSVHKGIGPYGGEVWWLTIPGKTNTAKDWYSSLSGVRVAVRTFKERGN